MGADITVRTIIGVKIDFETLRELSRSTTVPGCSHRIATRDDEFCSKCGARAWVRKKDLEEEEILESLCEEFDLSYIVDYDREVAFIGIVSNRVHHEDLTLDTCIPINTREGGALLVTEVHDKVARMCNQHKLGNMALMGFWTVMDVSV